MRRIFAALLLAPLLTGGVVPAPPNATLFASQPAFGREFWRLSGHLASANGRRFDFSVLFFRLRFGTNTARLDSASRWFATDLYPAEISVVDEARSLVWSERRIDRGALALAGASKERLDVHVDGWRVAARASTARAFEIALRARIEGVALDVQGRSQKPALNFPVANRERGTRGCATRESVVTSIASTGSLEIGGVRLAVNGTSWLDHEYGDRFTCSGERGWDRIWIQLDDGREILIERVRSRSGPVVTSVAILVEANGSETALPAGSYVLDNRGRTGWRSRHTGALYPSLWDLEIPAAGLVLSLNPVASDQEVVANGAGASFWEGALDVYDVGGGPWRRLGAAYAELTGYAGQPAL